MAWGKAKAHTLGQFGDGQATILLQLRKNLSINSVHTENSPNHRRHDEYL